MNAISGSSRSVRVTPEARIVASRAAPGGPRGRDEQQKDLDVTRLRQRDREVRSHEATHAAVGGAYVRGGPSFQYTQGPDGRAYADAGEVQIDTSEVPGDPAATAAKMQIVRRAALAVADPSSQDLAVAAQAAQRQTRALAELRTQGPSSETDRPPGTRLDLRA